MYQTLLPYASGSGGVTCPAGQFAVGGYLEFQVMESGRWTAVGLTGNQVALWGGPGDKYGARSWGFYFTNLTANTYQVVPNAICIGLQ